MGKWSGQKIPNLPTEERVRKNEIWAKYKLKWTDYLSMYDSQKGCCAICKCSIHLTSQGSSFVKGKIACVDHCHDSLKIRGLLCASCNKGLGQFGDNPVALRNAIEYLENVL